MDELIRLVFQSASYDLLLLYENPRKKNEFIEWATVRSLTIGKTYQT